MRLRVLDDVRPGYAQLAFDGPLTQPILSLSVRSQQESAFLGPDGSWQKSPHFFTATRIEGDANSALYRVGPEIVNFLRELDSVEFATEDGSLHLETTWENAVPQMPKVPGGRPGHSIYGVQSQPLEAAPISTASETVPTGEASGEHPRPTQDSALEHAASEESQEAEPALLTETETSQTSAGSSGPRRLDPGKRATDGKRGFLPLFLSLAALAIAGFIAYKFVPCEWLPQGHCPVDQNEVDARQKARVCAFYKSQGGLDCEVARDCVDPYFAKFPNGPARPELEAKAKTSNGVCKQMVETAETAFTCIDDLKKRGRSRCDVQVACTRNFQSLYPIGPLRRKVDDAAQQADVDCECERNPTSCGNRPRPDINPNAEAEAAEESAWQEASACANDDARKCASPGCYTDYLSKFGTSGIHKADAESGADIIAKSCANSDDKAALQAARECARGPRRCATRCYASYLSKYGTSGTAGSDAQTESAQLDSECKLAREEDDVWLSAKRCAAAATACDVAACFQDTYLRRYASGAHRSEASLEISQAQVACQKLSQQTLVAEGKYWGRSLAACGAKTDFSVNVNVKGNRITWEHDFLGVKYQWDGIIDPSGNVMAKVASAPGSTATGRFVEDGEKVIQMKYPQCTSGPVQLEIRGKYQ